MTTADQQRAAIRAATAERRAVEKVRGVEEARDALAAALRRAGIQLPAVDIRTPLREAAGYALVDLGVCAASVACELAAVINEGAAR